jgi:hypothetical protein
MPLPYMPRMVWTTAVGMRGPPEPPIASSTVSSCDTIVGDMLPSGRSPGASVL